MAEQLWRAVAVYRIAALVYATVLVGANHGNYARQALGWALLGVMAGWTALTVIAYATPSGRSRPLLLADVAVAVGMVLATLAVESAHRIDAGAPTLPAAWAAAPILAWAVADGPRGGSLAAVAVAAADIVERGAVTEHTFNGVVLLLFAGAVGGYVVRLGVRAETAIAAAARREAAVSERERLARSIHDSVLQVLALVSRRGAALGGESADLARLAGEQEAKLRALVSAPAPALDGAGAVDVRALLEPLATDRITISCPADAVRLPEHAAREVAAGTSAALDNVRRHAGEDARAWVLLENDGDDVVVSIRDDGVGMSPDRLEDARREGRLGVVHSILGRVRDLGGQATVTSVPGQGTEVELRVPRGR